SDICLWIRCDTTTAQNPAANCINPEDGDNTEVNQRVGAWLCGECLQDASLADELLDDVGQQVLEPDDADEDDGDQANAHHSDKTAAQRDIAQHRGNECH